jgi:hypothetical protein
MLAQIEGKISGTVKTPEIIITPEGIIRIQGRWMMENSAHFSKVLADWYDNHIFDRYDISAIDIYLEYFSSFNTGIFTSLLRKILCSKLIHSQLPVNWYYEEGDEDILDLGEYISTSLGSQFNFIMISGKETTDNII